MVDFVASLKKVIPSSGETRVLLGWGLATAVLILLEYVVFSLTSGASVSSGRLPVVRILGLGAGAYFVLMIRDIIAYYAGVSVDEMFTLSPVVVFGILAFAVGFLLYAIHDIQNVGTTMARSSRQTGGNLLSFFFEETPREGFEDDDEEDEGKPQKKPKQKAQVNEGMANQIGMNHYGAGSNPFQHTKSQSTRTGSSQGQDIRDMEQISNVMAGQQAPQQAQSEYTMDGEAMGGGVSSSGLGYATF